MFQLRLFIAAIVLLGTSQFANARKIELIQKSLRSHCQLEVQEKEALALMRPLYLSCIPDTVVKISENCRLHCLRFSNETPEILEN